MFFVAVRTQNPILGSHQELSVDSADSIGFARRTKDGKKLKKHLFLGHFCAIFCHIIWLISMEKYGNMTLGADLRGTIPGVFSNVTSLCSKVSPVTNGLRLLRGVILSIRYGTGAPVACPRTLDVMKLASQLSERRWVFFWDRCKVHIHWFLPWGFWLKVLKPSGIEPFARPGKAGLMFREAPVPTYIYLSNPYVSIYVHIFLYLSKSDAIPIYINHQSMYSYVMSFYICLFVYICIYVICLFCIHPTTYIYTLYIYIHISFSLSLSLSPSIPLSLYFSTYLSTYWLTYLPYATCLLTYPPTYLSTYLPIHQPTYLRARIYADKCGHTHLYKYVYNIYIYIQ